VTKIKQGCFI